MEWVNVYVCIIKRPLRNIKTLKLKEIQEESDGQKHIVKHMVKNLRLTQYTSLKNPKILQSDITETNGLIQFKQWKVLIKSDQTEKQDSGRIE